MLNMDQKINQKTGRRKNHQNWYRKVPDRWGRGMVTQMVLMNGITPAHRI